MTDRRPAGRPEALGAGDAAALRAVIAGHPFADGFDAAHVDALARIAGEIEIPAAGFVFHTGQPAEAVYLLVDGDVALEIAGAGHDPLVLETLHAGDTLGWSWLFAPHRWHLDAHATSDVRAVALDAARLRALTAQDAPFGREVALRVAGLVVDRLHHARSQLASVRLP